ncbi:FUSC family protein [Pseudomonas aeruginosa]|uniref:FUSC family protein n=1 Tax=Pseudomonas aeruginosa TaxID=287 RepID=UPI001C1DDB7C|nr:FUSC family protein [Pseudomonas aeruginosa]MBU5955894.1 FUSC family protein [Pseudomonas aeruginosa]
MAKPSFLSSDLLQVLLCPRLHELQFAVKALLAGGLALYLAFSLELEQPQWALMTVFVVSQPYSGMVLAKGMFRLLGTCAGALVSIGMVALYGQASLPFLLLMALWLAFCTAGASLLHNHASYGFVLAGYTAAIVALPASADPATVFDQAVARCSEIGLGILCAALVNVLLWPRRLERQLANQGKAAWEAGLQAAAAELRGADERAELLAAHGQLHLCLVCLERLLGEARAAGRSVEALVYGAPTRQAPGAIAWHRDIERGVLFGLRSALAFLCVAAFWLASAWPSGLGAVSITGVVLSLFASRDNPAQAGLNFLRGILLSIPLAGFVALFYLPGVDGFPLLCLGLGVPLFFAALCVNRASLAGIASPFCIFFVKNVAPSNSMSYDLAHFLNNALSTVLGVAFAVLVFNLVSLRPGERHYRRMLQATLGDLARLTLRSPAQAEAWFGGRTADRLIRLAQRYDRLPEGRRQPWSDGLMGLDFGDELLYLRQCLEEVPVSLAQARDRYLRRLRLALLGDGPRAEREHALDPPTARLLKALAASPLAGSERGELAGAALVQLQATWRQWCRSHAPAGTTLRTDPLPGAGR